MGDFKELKRYEKQVDSYHWNSLVPYTSYLYREDFQILHDSISFAMLDTITSSLVLVSLYASPSVNHSSRANTPDDVRYNLHLNELIAEGITLRGLGTAWLAVLTTTFALLQIAKYYTLYFVMKACHTQAARDRSHTLLQLAVGFTTLSLTVLLVFIIESSVLNILYGFAIFKVLGILVLLTVPADLALHTMTTFDYRFVRTNRIQARGYTQFNIRVAGTLAWAIYRYFTRDLDIELVYTLGDCAGLGFSVLLLSYETLNFTFFRFYWHHLITIFLHSLLFVAGCLQTFSCLDIVPFLGNALYIFKVTITPLIWFMLINVSHTSVRSLMSTGLITGHETAEQCVMFMEMLHFFYDHRKSSPDHEVQLLTSVITHLRACKDPLCMCFMLREKYDTSLGASNTILAKGLHKHFHQTTKGKIWNSLSTFSDRNSVEYRREIHNEYITAKAMSGMRKILISPENLPVDDKEKFGYVHNMDNEESFKLALSSMFFGIYRRFFEFNDTFKIALLFMSYLVSEYKNQLAALIFIYNHIYTRKYRSESSIFRDSIIQLLMIKSKRILKMTSDDNVRMMTQKFHLTKVLDYRLRIEKLVRNIKDLISQKIELYTGLSESEIDYLKTIKKGSALHRKTKETKREIETLLNINDRNFALIKEAANFELCVQEKHSVSDRLKKKAQQIYQEHKFQFGDSEKSGNNKFNFSLYSNSNIVLFLAYEDGDYRCFSHTQNACDLLEVTPTELAKNTLTEFMPSVVGIQHNRLVFDFINGNSRAKKSGKFNTFVISRKGKIRSCILIPKLDAGFLNNIYIAGLGILRDKNSNPMIYTTAKGSIVGMNSKANTILNKKTAFTETMIFSTFPKLHGTYFQEQSVGSYSAGKTTLGGKSSIFSSTNNLLQTKDGFTAGLDGHQQIVTMGMNPSASITMNGLQPQDLLQSNNQNGLLADFGEDEFLKDTMNYQVYMLQYNYTGTPDGSRNSKGSNKVIEMRSKFKRALKGDESPDTVMPDITRTYNTEEDQEIIKQKTTDEQDLRQLTDGHAKEVDDENEGVNINGNSNQNDTNSMGSSKGSQNRGKLKKVNADLENSRRSSARKSEAEETTLVIGIDDLINHQKALLESKNLKISKANISVENSRFQRQIKYKEVAIRSTQKVSASERAILKIMSTAPNELVEEILCGNPQVVSYLNKIIIYTRICQIIEEVLIKKFSKENLNQDSDNVDFGKPIYEPLSKKNQGKVAGGQVGFTKDTTKSSQKYQNIDRIKTTKPVGLSKDQNSMMEHQDLMNSDSMQDDGRDHQGTYRKTKIKVLPQDSKKTSKYQQNPTSKKSQLIQISYAEDELKTRENSLLKADGIPHSGVSATKDDKKVEGSMRKKHKEISIKINEIREELIQLMSNPMLLDKIVRFIVHSKVNKFHWTDHDSKTNIWGDVASVWLDQIAVDIGNLANEQIAAESPSAAAQMQDLSNQLKKPQSLEHVRSLVKQGGEIKDAVEAMVEYLLLNTAASSDEEEDEDDHNEGETEELSKSKKSLESEFIDMAQSSIDKNAKRDRKAISDALLTRAQIKTAHKRLHYRKWEKGMFVAILVCMTMKILFTNFLLSTSYTYKTSIENDKTISDLFEVFGYFFKETQKISVSKALIQKSGVNSGKNVAISSLYTAEIFSFYQAEMVRFSKTLTLNNEIPDKFMVESPLIQKTDMLDSTELLFRASLMVEMLASTFHPMNQSTAIWLTAVSQPLISRVDELWIEMSSITQQMTGKLIDYLRDRINRNSATVTKWKWIYVLNYFSEIYSLISIPIVIAALSVAIQHQTFAASEVLLRIERKSFRHAYEKILYHITADESKKKKTKQEGSEGKNSDDNQLIKVSDVKKANQEKQDPPTQVQRSGCQPGADSEDAAFNNRPRGKKRFVLHRASNTNKGGDGRKAYSVYTNRVAPYSTIKTYTWTCLMVFFMDILFLVTLILVVTNAQNFKLALDETVDVSMAKGSINIISGITYARFAASTTLALPVDSSVASTKLNLYQTTFDYSKSLKSAYFNNKILSSLLCTTALNEPGAGSTASCYSGLQIPTDYTIIQGLNQLDFRLGNLNIEIQSNPNHQSTLEFFTSTNYQSLENLIFYQSLSMKSIQSESINQINTDVNGMMTTYLVLVAIHLITEVLLTGYLKILWAPQRLHHWRFLQETFLTLNSDILSNIYVKTYFVNEMGG